MFLYDLTRTMPKYNLREQSAKGGEGVHCCMTARLKDALDVSVAKSLVPAFVSERPLSGPGSCSNIFKHF